MLHSVMLEVRELPSRILRNLLLITFSGRIKTIALFDSTRTYLAGSGGRIQLQKLNGHWNFMYATTWKTPGFETNDMGYMRQSDVALTVLWAGYNQWEPKGIYRSYNINGDVYSQMNFGGTILDYGLEYNVNMNLKNFWSAWAGGYVGTNNLDPTYSEGRPYDENPREYKRSYWFFI